MHLFPASSGRSRLSVSRSHQRERLCNPPGGTSPGVSHCKAPRRGISHKNTEAPAEHTFAPTYPNRKTRTRGCMWRSCRPHPESSEVCAHCPQAENTASHPADTRRPNTLRASSFPSIRTASRGLSRRCCFRTAPQTCGKALRRTAVCRIRTALPAQIFRRDLSSRHDPGSVGRFPIGCVQKGFRVLFS